MLNNNRGLAKANLERYEEAIEDYGKTLNTDPNHQKVLDNKALAMQKN